MVRILIILILIFQAVPIMAKEPDQKSYYQHPESKTLQGATIWNPIIHEKNGKVVKKSFFRYPDSKVLPRGSLWNPLVSTKEKPRR